MNRRQLERIVIDLAEGQWGLVTSAQAHAAGVTRVQLSRLADDAMLTRLAHGVYALRGAAETEHLNLRAAWLALDPDRPAVDRLREPTRGAVVSHASAARLHGLGDLDADRHEFILPERRQTRRSELRLHRGVLTPAEVMTVAGLPTATPERVVVDLLADRQDGEHVARVLGDAVRQRSVDPAQLTPRLSPFAVRFGLSAGRGDLLLEHLLDLGNAADHVLADRLVSAARTNNLRVTQVIRALESPRVRRQIEQVLAEEPEIRRG